MLLVLRNLQKFDNQFIFTIVEIDTFEPDLPEYSFHLMTNEDGEGLFYLNDYYHQLLATCDFSLSGMNISSARSYIKRRLAHYMKRI